MTLFKWKMKQVKLYWAGALIVLGILATTAAGETSAEPKEKTPTSQPAKAPTSYATTGPTTQLSLALDDYNKSENAAEQAESEPAPPPAQPSPPLPFHSIEGYGGGAITPMAYLVNPGPKGQIFGLPSGAVSNVIMGKKNLQAVTITETLFQRLELGYGLDRFGVGTLDEDIRKATGVDIEREEVWLHNFNLRGLLLEENSFGLPLPAITAGTHFKLNDGIADVNRRLGGALSNIGYERDNGVDFTLTASKTFAAAWTLNRPLILSAGLRNSSASQLGFLGFGDDRSTTFEGNIAYLPTNWLLVAYEYRQKGNPYGQIPGLIGEEDDWQAIDASWIINDHATLVAGWGGFGTLANTRENGAWFLQFKYEF
jgi:hypothetical protein